MIEITCPYCNVRKERDGYCTQPKITVTSNPVLLTDIPHISGSYEFVCSCCGNFVCVPIEDEVTKDDLIDIVEKHLRQSNS